MSTIKYIAVRLQAEAPAGNSPQLIPLLSFVPVGRSAKLSLFTSRNSEVPSCSKFRYGTDNQRGSELEPLSLAVILSSLAPEINVPDFQ